MVLGSDLGRHDARRGTAALAAVLVLLLAPALAACSDDDGDAAGTAPATSSAPASAPADRAAAETQIRQNWEKFFDPATSTADKQAVLENGERMGPVLQAFGGDRRGGQVAAQVQQVEFTGPTRATVTYTLTLDGATALPDASGTAVEQDGSWKVSVSTLCALVQLSGDGSSSVPGC
ncbi:hypothetical protein JCM4814A_57000 [Streptomyces phaeofaciens JCM 4814]|uniref:Low molecular weight antigen MTB12-like C-terminal domain-containing protein n=1 Tax=Streptomyces phaeofaciens TaxID=68254 RepID=A0A918HR81_9ACTN|nr:hypothetical protein [Streptomyces phaeofaciens]GGT88887.1 hypothetical protein GCM10010226_79040 [Streptomyces phaeofaciens]